MGTTVLEMSNIIWHVNYCMSSTWYIFSPCWFRWVLTCAWHILMVLLQFSECLENNIEWHINHSTTFRRDVCQNMKWRLRVPASIWPIMVLLSQSWEPAVSGRFASRAEAVWSQTCFTPGFFNQYFRKRKPNIFSKRSFINLLPVFGSHCAWRCVCDVEVCSRTIGMITV